MLKYKLSETQLEERIATVNELLRNERKKRVFPGIDDKSLTSWNALLVTGLCDAYATFGEEEYKHLAHKIVRWISTHQLKSDFSLYRTRKNGTSTIDGFLEDYATVIQAFTRFYEITADEEYLLKAQQLTMYTISHFQHPESKMFYFTPDSTTLIARKMDINDNVIPASNSIMANNLWNLGHLFEQQEWLKDARQQLMNLYDGMEQYGSGYSNWAILLLNNTNRFYEVVVSGDTSGERLSEWQQIYAPHTITAYNSEVIPLGKHKNTAQNLFYICSETDGCLPPVSDLKDILELIQP